MVELTSINLFSTWNIEGDMSDGRQIQACLYM